MGVYRNYAWWGGGRNAREITDNPAKCINGCLSHICLTVVVRDKRSNKTKGYGFVSFKDPADFTRAIKV